MTIVHFQLNMQTTTDINLTGLKRDALDKPATTKHAREFKEAWHSMHKLTFNRHIDIPTIYLQLKHSRKSSTSSSLTFNPLTTSLPTTTDDDNNHLRTIATNDNHLRTRNTCMQQPLAFISKHCVNMKYFGLYQQ